MADDPMSPSRQRVIDKARAVFPDRRVEDVLSQLDQYGTEEHHRERDRVHLAILKLCQESGPASLADQVRAAQLDYRDVLAWAEYPGQMSPKWFSLPAEEQALIVRADVEQYRAWLTTN